MAVHESRHESTLCSVTDGGHGQCAGALSFPLKKLFVMDGSKRSGHSNAYMYGFFNNKRIVIYDTLIAQCTEGQVVAVLAHELGHWKLSHTLCLMLIGQATLLLQFGAFTLIRASPTLFGDFGFTGAQPVIMALVLFQMVMTPVDSLLHYMNNIISRRCAPCPLPCCVHSLLLCALCSIHSVCVHGVCTVQCMLNLAVRRHTETHSMLDINSSHQCVL